LQHDASRVPTPAHHDVPSRLPEPDAGVTPVRIMPGGPPPSSRRLGRELGRSRDRADFGGTPTVEFRTNPSAGFGLQEVGDDPGGFVGSEFALHDVQFAYRLSDERVAGLE